MLVNILQDFKIKYFAHISSEYCTAQNLRLYNSLPGDCRVIFMLFPYYVKNTDPALSKFAAVPDYHLFTQEVFAAMEQYIHEKYGTNIFAKGFADHSPYNEREGAWKAGLGIMGQNGLLINQEYSSFVCIGELVTTLDSKTLTAEGIPSAKENIKEEYCHGCTACKLSCPGTCAGRDLRDTCASAINQLKRELSESEKDIVKKSGYAWGCDICQNVCPYTRTAIANDTIETPIDFFHKGAIEKNCREIISRMNEEEFKNYPFSWRKKEIIMRNFEIMDEKL